MKQNDSSESRKISINSIYDKYQLLPALKLHQLRVAAVALYICDHFLGEVDVHSVISACLLHDMGNIVKFDLSKLPTLLEPEGFSYRESIQREFRNKYGIDDHHATNLILKEINVSRKVHEIIDTIGFSSAEVVDDQVPFENKIALYADQRVGPYGVVMLSQRLAESKERYKNHAYKNEWTNKYEDVVRAIEMIEYQIFSYLKIAPDDVTEEIIQPYINKLRLFKI